MPKSNPQKEWYNALKKPSFAPPAWLFGAIWSVLYGIIGFSYLFVIRKIAAGDIPVSLIAPLGLNLLFNLLYSPIQFRLKNNYLAFADCVLVVITLGWLLIAVFPYAPIVVYVNLPYLLWGLFATVLQESIARLNRKA